MRAFQGKLRSGGRVVEGARLESEYTAKPYRGFESLPLRQPRRLRLSDDPQLAALPRRRIADHAQFGLKPGEFALLGLARLLGVPFLDFRFLVGLRTEV